MTILKNLCRRKLSSLVLLTLWAVLRHRKVLAVLNRVRTSFSCSHLKLKLPLLPQHASVNWQPARMEPPFWTSKWVARILRSSARGPQTWEKNRLHLIKVLSYWILKIYSGLSGLDVRLSNSQLPALHCPIDQQRRVRHWLQWDDKWISNWYH